MSLNTKKSKSRRYIRNEEAKHDLAQTQFSFKHGSKSIALIDNPELSKISTHRKYRAKWSW